MENHGDHSNHGGSENMESHSDSGHSSAVINWITCTFSTAGLNIVQMTSVHLLPQTVTADYNHSRL